MLSILIPVYNTSVIQLVSQISNMAKYTGFDYELRIADDASTDEILKSENQKLAQTRKLDNHPDLKLWHFFQNLFLTR